MKNKHLPSLVNNLLTRMPHFASPYDCLHQFTLNLGHRMKGAYTLLEALSSCMRKTDRTLSVRHTDFDTGGLLTRCTRVHV